MTTHNTIGLGFSHQELDAARELIDDVTKPTGMYIRPASHTDPLFRMPVQSSVRPVTFDEHLAMKPDLDADRELDAGMER